jgi:glycerate dehydrogenase
MESLKILITDGHALFQDDIPMNALDLFGSVIWRPRTYPDELLQLPADANVLITNKYVIGQRELDHFPKLRLIAVSATGYNCVDTTACRAKGVTVCNVPAYGTYSVAQHALAMLLDHSNRVSLHAASVERGEWSSNADWCYTLSPIREWHGKTLGILGMGRIGSCLAGMAEALGMRVIYHHTRDLEMPGRSLVDLHTLAAESDVISLHCPLTPQTRHIVNASFLGMMKREGVIINTSRGPLIDNEALADALRSGKIAGALLDVLDTEPPPADHPLIGCPNAIITPHIAWISSEARARIVDTLREVLTGCIEGRLNHIVN